MMDWWKPDEETRRALRRWDRQGVLIAGCAAPRVLARGRIARGSG